MWERKKGRGINGEKKKQTDERYLEMKKERELKESRRVMKNEYEEQNEEFKREMKSIK